MHANKFQTCFASQEIRQAAYILQLIWCNINKLGPPSHLEVSEGFGELNVLEIVSFF